LGVIIVDGRAALQFEGSVLEFEKAVRGLVKFQNEIGPSSLMIDTVPLPESGAIIVDMRFRGSMSDFENVINGLDDLRSMIAIDTVPLPTRAPKIGTWPTPETPENAFGWSIFAYVTEK
jgi:hypothetical protein